MNRNFYSKNYLSKYFDKYIINNKHYSILELNNKVFHELVFNKKLFIEQYLDIKNFRRNKISDTLGALSWPDRKHPQYSWFDNTFLHYFYAARTLRILKKIWKVFAINKNDNIGNPHNYFFLNYANLVNNYFYQNIIKNIKLDDYEEIYEIGGGFGFLLGIFILNNPPPQKKIFIFTEQPNMLLQSYYYINQIILKNKLNYNINFLKNKNISDINLIQLNDFHVNKNKKKKLLLNVASFQHFSKKNFLFYSKNLKKIDTIVSINRISPKREEEFDFNKEILNDFNLKSRLILSDYQKNVALDVYTKK